MASEAITFAWVCSVMFILLGLIGGLVAVPVSIQFPELEKHQLTGSALVPFGSVFHFDPAASDVGVHVKILSAELFEVLGLGRLLFPIEPVSPAKSRDLRHGQPPVALFRFNHFLTQLDEQLGQIDLAGLAIIVELGDLVVRIDRLNWQWVLDGNNALGLDRLYS